MEDASSVPEYERLSAPYADFLSRADRHIGSGYAWAISGFGTGKDAAEPTCFVLLDGGGDRMCAIRPVGGFSSNGEYIILDSSFRMVARWRGVYASMAHANDLVKADMLQSDMTKVKPDSIMSRLEYFLDEMLIGASGTAGIDGARIAINIAIAVISACTRRNPDNLMLLVGENLGKYADVVNRFNFAIRQDDGPDWESAQSMSLDISVTRSSITTLVAAHLNQATGSL